MRHALGAFPTGVTVVCTQAQDGAPVGFTANSFTSVSLDPPLVLVCLGHGASSHAAFSAAEHFAVSVLSAAQQAVAMRFATRGADRFGPTDWGPRLTGAPVIDNAAAWFDCRLHQRAPAGDHDILIGEVVAFHRSAAAPIGYVGGRFAAVDADLRVAALVHCDGAALFLEDPADGGLRLPSARRFGGVDDPHSLTGALSPACDGLEALRPVEAISASDGHTTVYAATARRLTPPTGWRALPMAQAADAMACPAQAAVVRTLAATLG